MFAYRSLAWGLDSRDAFVKSEIEHHAALLSKLEAHLSQLEDNLQSTAAGLASEMNSNVNGLRTDFGSWARGFAAQDTATSARLDVVSARSDSAVRSAAATKEA